jgi:hypothetical protein
LPGIEIVELATHCHNEQARNAAAFQYGKHVDGIADTAALHQQRCPFASECGAEHEAGALRFGGHNHVRDLIILPA